MAALSESGAGSTSAGGGLGSSAGDSGTIDPAFGTFGQIAVAAR